MKNVIELETVDEVITAFSKARQVNENSFRCSEELMIYTEPNGRLRMEVDSDDVVISEGVNVAQFLQKVLSKQFGKVEVTEYKKRTFY